VTVFRVALEYVTPLWPQLEPLVARALEGHLPHDVEDMRKMLLGGNTQLWVQWDGERVEAMAMTEFAPFPQGVWVRVILVAARPDARLDSEAFFTAITQWKDMHGCRGLEAIGRVGWARRFPSMKQVGVLLRSDG
jgi:hypothetical protein